MSATSTSAPAQASVPPLDVAVEADQFVEIDAVGWAGYKRYLQARGERSRPKMIYFDGDLILVSPAEPHESLNYRIGAFVLEVLSSLRIRFRPLGQTTLRRRSKRGGVEGDQAYYLASEKLVRGKPRVDLRIDPPPDLAIEVIHTHKAEASLKVYGSLGVPEVWVCDENRVAILVCQENGDYKGAERSLALPFLTATEIFAQTQKSDSVDMLDWLDSVRRWVHEVLVPRVPPA